ncbi:uncharacterized, partial [Lates japonicus]
MGCVCLVCNIQMKDPRFLTRMLCCNQMINVIHFICQVLMLGLISVSLSQCQWRVFGGGVSEDLESFEQGECGGPPFALSSGRLHGHQFGRGGGRQLLVAGSGEGGDTKERLVLADVDSWYQTTTLPSPPHPPHSLIEDVLHRWEVQTGRHLKEQTAKTRCQGLAVTLTHLSETQYNNSHFTEN